MVPELQARRDAIRTLLRTQKIGSQEELRELLAKKGFDVTQATLSRDLALLKARRVTLAEGGTVYEVDDFRATPVDGELAALRHLVTSVSFNDSLVVVMTVAAAASVVATAIDRARLNTVLGTIAGDDTIVVVTSGATGSRDLVERLLGYTRRDPS